MDNKFHDGQYIVGEVSHITAREMIPSVFDYIEYDFNKQSVWELFLLSISWKYLPLYWHACYASVTYIFDMSDLEQLVSSRILHYDYRKREQIDITSDVAAYIGDESLLPEITLLSDSVAQLRYSYWGRWRGLVRVMIRIAKENGTTTFTHISDETLVEYDCGWVV